MPRVLLCPPAAAAALPQGGKLLQSLQMGPRALVGLALCLLALASCGAVPTGPQHQGASLGTITVSAGPGAAAGTATSNALMISVPTPPPPPPPPPPPVISSAFVAQLNAHIHAQLISHLSTCSAPAPTCNPTTHNTSFY